jgi:hypothetical protein
MPCGKSSLQPFVDWLSQAPKEWLVPIISAHLRQQPATGLSFLYVGVLDFVPVKILGTGSSGRRFASFLHGNLIETGGGSPNAHVFIELFDPIEILIEYMGGGVPVNWTNTSCASSGDNLTISSPGDDGGSYEITLRKTFFLPRHVPIR